MVQYRLVFLLGASLAALGHADHNSTDNATESGSVSQTTSNGGKTNCFTSVVSISATANNVKVLIPAPSSNEALTEFYVESFQANSQIAAKAIGGANAVSGAFGIFTKLCVPDQTQNAVPLQILTHGGTLDNTYWDIAPGYSYVDSAAANGYATLSYDRLGTGRSDHPDPLGVVQIPIQLEILHAIVVKARQAQFKGLSFSKVVGVGHSLGAGIVQAVAAKYPQDFDALILQGTSTVFQYATIGVASEDQQIANTDPSGKFTGLADGYTTPANIPFASQFAFYRYPNYDPKIFDILTKNKQTNSIGEGFTLIAAYAPATAYTGHVDIVNGQNDWFYCGGDCTYPTDQAAAALKAYFPNAGAGSSSYLLNGAGHNVNAHYGAADAFAQMLGFLKNVGI